MSEEEWLLETGPHMKAPVVTLDRRPLAERSKLVDRGLVDFRRVCDQMDILDPETDTIRASRPFEWTRHSTITLFQPSFSRSGRMRMESWSNTPKGLGRSLQSLWAQELQDLNVNYIRSQSCRRMLLSLSNRNSLTMQTELPPTLSKFISRGGQFSRPQGSGAGQAERYWVLGNGWPRRPCASAFSPERLPDTGRRGKRILSALGTTEAEAGRMKS
jgi:hypothetical protein